MELHTTACGVLKTMRNLRISHSRSSLVQLTPVRVSLCKRPRSFVLPLATSTGHVRNSGTGIDHRDSVRQVEDTDFPLDSEGRTFHLATKKGEVANRIVMVGSCSRAQSLSKLLEPPEGQDEVFHYVSKRQFTTYTGRFNGVPVSIVTSLMGMPNMDFAVRESHAVVEGPMAVIRLGTCGVIQPPGRVGTMLIASKGAVSVRGFIDIERRNPDAFNEDSQLAPYIIHKRVLPDAQLSHLLKKHANIRYGGEDVLEVLNASADSFYSSQGRLGTLFDDRNEDLVEKLLSDCPDAVTLEMETFHLLDLARVSKGAITASAACIALMERHTNTVVDMGIVESLEHKAGLACLAAITEYQPPGL